MHCDVYSLGFGLVSVRTITMTFGLRNLQVHYGYRYERIPDEVLLRACGPLGHWRPTDMDPPLLEIVPHHEQPQVWTRLPAELRSTAIRKAGTRQPILVTNEILDRLFPGFAVPKALAEPEVVIPASPIRNLVREALPETRTGAPVEIELDEPVNFEVEPPKSEPALMDMPDLIDHEDDGTCRGKTGAGGRCQRKATIDGYCKTHVGQAKPAGV